MSDTFSRLNEAAHYNTAFALMDAAEEIDRLTAELREMTEARDALLAAYAVLATNNDAQRTAQARIVAEEVARAEARAAGMADKPGVTNE